MALGLLLTLCGCAPVVRQAPFPVRPDTTLAGDLRGPFDGRVTEAATDKPVAGALVAASWEFEEGGALTGPAGTAQASTETDSDGRYRLPRLDRFPHGGARLTRATLIVYRRGYLAYRSDRRFEDLKARTDFSQTRNLVRLERLAPEVSHVQHVRFAGGGGALYKALGPERVQASLELSSGAPTPGEDAKAAPLDAGLLLSVAELREATGYTGELQLERLADVPRSAAQDGIHFRAVGQPESFDAAVRVWRLPDAESARARYEELVGRIPNASRSNELGDASVRGQEEPLLTAATLDSARHLVLQLTCGKELCRDAEQTVDLLRRASGRADRLIGAGAAALEGPPSSEAPPAASPPGPELPSPSPSPGEGFRLRPPELHR